MVLVSRGEEVGHFEIGRRLKHVKENDLAHGDWTEWCEEDAGIPTSSARKFIKVAEELSTNRSTSNTLGLDALYLIATLPETERDTTHTTSRGEEKNPEDMTVKELRELKRHRWLYKNMYT